MLYFSWTSIFLLFFSHFTSSSSFSVFLYICQSYLHCHPVFCFSFLLLLYNVIIYWFLSTIHLFNTLLTLILSKTFGGENKLHSASSAKHLLIVLIRVVFLNSVIHECKKKIKKIYSDYFHINVKSFWRLHIFKG